MFAKFVLLICSIFTDMATVKFRLLSKNSNAPIYCYFSLGRGKFYQRKTREYINPENWNAKKGLPKNIQAATAEVLNDLETLRQKLADIESFVLKQYSARKDTDIINGTWLADVLDAFYNGRKKKNELEYIENYLQYYLDNILPVRTFRDEEISYRTKQKQITIIRKFQEFLITEKKRLKVSDYNILVGNRFKTYLNSQNLSKNTVNKYLKYTRTIFKDALNLGIDVNRQLEDIKGGKNTETPTPYLKLDELSAIQELTFLDENLETARDWLIIGCYTGQRASDLFLMNENKIKNINGKDFINLSQKKTKNPVSIPVHNEVKKVLDKRGGKFPPVFSDNPESAKTLFNNHLQTIAKRAKLNRLEYGKKWQPAEKKGEKGKFVFGNYPLSDIISSHICRRTFATMYYAKIPTPIIMAVTGHTTETQLINYVGRKNIDLTEKMFDYWERMENTEPQQDTKTAN